jgi:hypothetical protein
VRRGSQNEKSKILANFEDEGQMTKNNLKPVAMAIGSTVVLAMSATVSAQNPFQMVEFGDGYTVATDSVDMQGKITLSDETGFTCGGGGQAKYAGGKLATGTTDPAVCGTFAGASCSMDHLEK